MTSQPHSPSPSGDAFDLFDSAFLRRLETLTIAARRIFAGRLRGEQRSNRHGSSVEFADFRPYSQGDDFRRIDWNAYARFGHLFLKLFSEEQDLLLYLLVDRSASMGFGRPVTKFDQARRIAAALAYVALANLDRVALVSLAHGETPAIEDATAADTGDASAERAARHVQDHLAYVRGKGSIFSVFDFLRRLPPGGQTDLERSIRDFVTRWRHKGVVILLSDMLSPTGYEEPLKALDASGFQPMVVQVLAPEELDPDLQGDFRLVDSETGNPVDISTTHRLLDAYRRRARGFVDGLDTFCKQRNIACLRASTDDDIESLILGALRRAALVR